MAAYTLEEIQEHRNQWTAALRSGKYRQARGNLKTVWAATSAVEEQAYMCVMGVACEISGLITWIPNPARETQNHTFYEAQAPTGEYSGIMLPEIVREWLGLAEPNGVFVDTKGTTKVLAALNDDGADFPYLADLIESNPVDLWESPALASQSCAVCKEAPAVAGMYCQSCLDRETADLDPGDLEAVAAFLEQK